MNNSKISESIKLLRLFKENGVDEIIANSSFNRIKNTEKLRKKDLILENDTINSNKNMETNQINKISSLEELKSFMSDFKGCELYKSSTNMVFSDGNPKSEIMLIGEAPGHDEDIQGKPFVGRSGKLLDKMLEAIELNREKVYIANIIPWRPPSNRRPTDEEIEICLPFIKKHIELIKPKVLMLLGSTATFALLKNTEGISKIRGKWVDLNLNSISVPTLPTFHPAFLLRQPAQKKHVWEDLKSLKNKVSN
jgi:DNA polymerase